MIYLDYASTTPTNPLVVKAMLPYFSKHFGNPSSQHNCGKEAQAAVTQACETIAKILHCKPEEILFTSGGTESINLALQGVPKGHIIISNIEHKAVMNTCDALKKRGYTITKVPVDSKGIVDPQAIEKAIQKNTTLISVIYANNEIGTIQPIQAIGKIAKKHKILFHTDACQAASLNLNTKTLGVDMVTLNGSKIYGPKGIGILFKKSSVPLKPLLFGGGQQRSLRSGTLNVPGIVGIAKALELYTKTKYQTTLRDFLITECRKIGGKLNGHASKRLWNNVNVDFGVDSESIVRHLNHKGICISTGSACNSQEIQTSHILRALGKKEGVRISLGKKTTKKELQILLRELSVILGALRQL